MLCGPSSGMNVVAAQKVAAKHPELRRIVTVVPDTGQRYLSGELFGEGRRGRGARPRPHAGSRHPGTGCGPPRPPRVHRVSEPWELTAVDALARMRAKELSPVELLASVQTRAETVEPTVNAFTEQRDDAALLAANDSAERYARGEDVRPLEGLPVALKEEVPVEGWRMRYGSLAVDEIATETAPIAERIFAAGAVVHARTATPEFSCTGYTHSKLWGVTRNPWNPERRGRWVERRLGGVARLRHLDARERLGHRRVDPRSRPRSTASSGSRRRTAVCRPERRTTSTAIATTGRSPERSRTARCSRTCSRARTRPTSRRCGPSSRSPTGSRGSTASGSPLGRPRLRGTSTTRSLRTPALPARRWIEAGAKVDEVEIPWNLELVMDASRGISPRSSAPTSRGGRGVPDLVNDYVHAWAEESRG